MAACLYFSYGEKIRTSRSSFTEVDLTDCHGCPGLKSGFHDYFSVTEDEGKKIVNFVLLLRFWAL